MRQRFERVTRKHHHPDSDDAQVEAASFPPPSERLQRELERIVEVIDEALEANADLERRA